MTRIENNRSRVFVLESQKRRLVWSGRRMKRIQNMPSVFMLAWPTSSVDVTTA
jgi:hypothetical protein